MCTTRSFIYSPHQIQKGASICCVRPARHISKSLAFIGTTSKGEVSSVTENYSKFEVRALVRFLQAETSQSEIHLSEGSRIEILGRKEVTVWCKET
jgi:hypothetical protein